MAPPVGTTP